MPTEALLKWELPFPPLKEQHRIVAKVEAFMGLCDRLETQIERSQGAAEQLLEVVLHGAAEPAAIAEVA